jgi:hypothetical protein
MSTTSTAPQKIVRTTLKLVLLHREDVDPSNMSLLKIFQGIRGAKVAGTKELADPTLLGVYTRTHSEEIFGEDSIVRACQGFDNDGSFFLDGSNDILLDSVEDSEEDSGENDSDDSDDN